MSIKCQFAFMLSVSLSLTFSSSLFSQQSGQVSTSTGRVGSSSFSQALKKAIPDRVSYFSIISGPNLDDGGDPFNEDGTVNEGGFSTWNQVSLQWQLNDRFRFVFNPRFEYIFSENRAEDETPFSLINPVAGITGLWYKNGNFQFGGGVNTILPPMREDDTIQDGLIFNPGGFNDARYTMGKFAVGSWIWARYMVYDRAAVGEDTRYATFLAPYANYAASDMLSFTTFYQINGEETYDDSLFFDETEDSLNIMASIRISSMLTLEPMITTFRETDFDVAQGNLNVWLSGRFH